jgi:hypothetical protein
LVTHGSCCRGADSGYNIRVGRAKKVTGPFLDNMGVDMIQGGGKLFATSAGRVIGPGHFGLFELGDGVQRFSLHYEADLDRGGASVLDIRARCNGKTAGQSRATICRQAHISLNPCVRALRLNLPSKAFPLVADLSDAALRQARHHLRLVIKGLHPHWAWHWPRNWRREFLEGLADQFQRRMLRKFQRNGRRET